MRAKGIDVSHNQGSFEPKGNLDFVIVKASGRAIPVVEGLWTDPKFHEFVDNLKPQVNLLTGEIEVPMVGAYHYFIDRDDPIAQAHYFLSLVDEHNNIDFIAVDYEGRGNRLDHQGALDLLKMLNHLRTVQPLPVLLYTGSYIYRDNVRIWSDKFDEFPLWVAKWSEVEPGQIIEREWSIWQWTDSGDGSQVGVGSDRVDRNVYNGTVEQMKLWLGMTPPEENDMKKWYQSKTLWFSILFALVNVAGIFGYAEFIPGEDVVQYLSLIHI